MLTYADVSHSSQSAKEKKKERKRKEDKRERHTEKFESERESEREGGRGGGTASERARGRARERAKRYGYIMQLQQSCNACCGSVAGRERRDTAIYNTMLYQGTCDGYEARDPSYKRSIFSASDGNEPHELPNCPTCHANCPTCHELPNICHHFIRQHTSAYVTVAHVTTSYVSILS